MRDAVPAATSGRVTADNRSRSASTSSMGSRATRAADTVALTSDSNSAKTAALARPVAAKNTRTERTRSRHSEYGVSDVNQFLPALGISRIRGRTPLHPHRMSLRDTPRNPPLAVRNATGNSMGSDSIEFLLNSLGQLCPKESMESDPIEFCEGLDAVDTPTHRETL